MRNAKAVSMTDPALLGAVAASELGSELGRVLAGPKRPENVTDK